MNQKIDSEFFPEPQPQRQHRHLFNAGWTEEKSRQAAGEALQEQGGQALGRQSVLPRKDDALVPSLDVQGRLSC